MTPHLRSILMLLVTMLIWGSTFVVTKGVIETIAPFTLGFVRVAIGALILLPYALARQRRARQALPWGAILLLALTGVALYYAAFNFSMLYTSASQGALVQSCIPGVTALIAAVWLRERPTAGRWLGIALSIVGVLIVFSGNRDDAGSTALLGNLLMFATTVCWAFYTALAKRIAAVDPVVVTAGVTGTGALMLLPFAAVEWAQQGLPQIAPLQWLAVLYLGAAASGVAYLLYSSALKHMDAGQAGVYTNLIPLVGVISGIVVLDEPLSPRAIVGGCVVLAGVWLTSRREPRRQGSSDLPVRGDAR